MKKRLNYIKETRFLKGCDRYRNLVSLLLNLCLLQNFLISETRFLCLRNLVSDPLFIKKTTKLHERNQVSEGVRSLSLDKETWFLNPYLLKKRLNYMKETRFLGAIATETWFLCC
ncbi:MAG TPA: hypothetical protein V6C58_00010 [Allocoleopsis sp.]